MISTYTQFFDQIKTDVSKNLNKIIDLRASRKSKSDKSFVTEGDLLINDIVNDIAKKYFNNYEFVSEEDKNRIETANDSVTIVIDPIDGTENFTSGFPEWGISISVYKMGAHKASLLACPEMDLWIKTGDQVAKNYSRIRGLSSSLTMNEILELTQGHEYRILGCCVYNMINAIKGSFLSFENPKGAHSWDILAGLNLALEHNLKVTVEGNAYHGEYLQPTGKYKFKVENQ